MPGGDVGAEGPSQTVEPVAATRRGPDWIAALAWGGAGLFALVVAGLATVGFQTIAPQWPAISARWQMAIFVLSRLSRVGRPRRSWSPFRACRRLSIPTCHLRRMGRVGAGSSPIQPGLFGPRTISRPAR